MPRRSPRTPRKLRGGSERCRGARNGSVELEWYEQGDGEPLLLIMGLGGSAQAWYRLLPNLAPGLRAGGRSTIAAPVARARSAGV